MSLCFSCFFLENTESVINSEEIATFSFFLGKPSQAVGIRKVSEMTILEILNLELKLKYFLFLNCRVLRVFRITRAHNSTYALQFNPGKTRVTATPTE